jgi:hypothetical protein
MNDQHHGRACGHACKPVRKKKIIDRGHSRLGHTGRMLKGELQRFEDGLRQKMIDP